MSRRTDIQDFFNTNEGNPQAVMQAMTQYGVSADELKTAMDYKLNTDDYLRNGGAADGFGGLKVWTPSAVNTLHGQPAGSTVSASENANTQQTLDREWALSQQAAKYFTPVTPPSAASQPAELLNQGSNGYGDFGPQPAASQPTADQWLNWREAYGGEPLKSQLPQLPQSTADTLATLGQQAAQKLQQATQKLATTGQGFNESAGPAIGPFAQWATPGAQAANPMQPGAPVYGPLTTNMGGNYGSEQQSSFNTPTLNTLYQNQQQRMPTVAPEFSFQSKPAFKSGGVVGALSRVIKHGA